MTTAAFELLRHASANRETWLRRFYSIGKEAVRPRRVGELYGFELTPSRNGLMLTHILRRGGVEIDYGIPPGTPNDGRSHSVEYIRMAQPYGAFAKALLEAQHYPDLRDASGHPIPPYDVTAHTLPLLMGVEVKPIYR